MNNLVKRTEYSASQWLSPEPLLILMITLLPPMATEYWQGKELLENTAHKHRKAVSLNGILPVFVIRRLLASF